MSPAASEERPAVRNLLFVDDETRVLDSIRRSLHSAEPAWRLFFADSVGRALELLGRETIDVVITDVTMPGRDGFDLMSAISADPLLKQIPTVVLTGLADTALKRRALDAGAFDLIGKPIHTEDLVARLRSVLRTRDYQDSLTSLNATLERKVTERTAALNASRTDILLSLAMAGECRDSETGRHVIRVSHYSRLLATALGLGREDVTNIFHASTLHDIGKLGIPDHILRKPGPLSDTEKIVMQTHCEIGHRILGTQDAMAAAFELGNPGTARPTNPLLVSAATIALCHHEKWDGTGYPRRLSGPQIPPDARIVALADVYDALTTRRAYKTALSHQAASSIIAEQSGYHFEPAASDAFQRIESHFDAIRAKWSDSTNPVDGPSDRRDAMMPGARAA